MPPQAPAQTPPTAPIVTLDGPSGSGKGTISRRLAVARGWRWLDSGALYRLVALVAERAGWRSDHPDGLAQAAAAARAFKVRFAVAGCKEKVLLDGEDVTAAIRTDAIAESASGFAVHNQIRTALLELQRGFNRPPGLVADGRDMGTVVFPNADLKIFVTASAAERARRRQAQLSVLGVDASIDRIYQDILARDERDAAREHSPLRPAADAIELDTTGLDVEGSVAQVRALLAERSI